MQKCFEVIDLAHMQKIVKVILENVLFYSSSIVSYVCMPTDAE